MPQTQTVSRLPMEFSCKRSDCIAVLERYANRSPAVARMLGEMRANTEDDATCRFSIDDGFATGLLGGDDLDLRLALLGHAPRYCYVAMNDAEIVSDFATLAEAREWAQTTSRDEYLIFRRRFGDSAWRRPRLYRRAKQWGRVLLPATGNA